MARRNNPGKSGASGARNRPAHKPRTVRLLERLSGDEAIVVLNLLLKSPPELRDEAEQAARDFASSSSAAEVAENVWARVTGVEPHDSTERAAAHPRGSVDPSQ